MSNLSAEVYEFFFNSQGTGRHYAVFLSILDNDYVICAAVVLHHFKSV